jgi:hypothetical protein
MLSIHLIFMVEPIGVRQMTVMAARAVMTNGGTLRLPSGQKLWHLFPDNLRHGISTSALDPTSPC